MPLVIDAAATWMPVAFDQLLRTEKNVTILQIRFLFEYRLWATWHFALSDDVSSRYLFVGRMVKKNLVPFLCILFSLIPYSSVFVPDDYVAKNVSETK